MVSAKNIVLPKRGLTHAGVFHADDVFATALLRSVNPTIKIVRSNNVPPDFDGVVYDIGGGKFDHHQADARIRDNGVPFGAFGLLWESYGSLLLEDGDARAFDETFVQPLDLADNSGAHSDLACCVSDFNPSGAKPVEEFNKAFWSAVDWAQGVLCRRLNRVNEEREDYSYVRAAMERGDGKILILQRAASWKKAVAGSTYLYVVYPSLRGGFNAQAVPSQLDADSLILPFPQPWRGLSNRALADATGVVDAVFCHKSGFLCAAQTEQGAASLARMSLSVGGNGVE